MKEHFQQTHTRTGRAHAARRILAAALALILHSPFSILNSPAAALSLSSTNDYIYVSLPTNGPVEVLGLGTGPEGLYLMPRREDLLFLAEAFSERTAVSDALQHDAEAIGTNRWSALSKRYYSILPSPQAQMAMWPSIKGICYTNMANITMPTNYITSPVVENTTNVWQSDVVGYDRTAVKSMMFADRTFPTCNTILRMDRQHAMYARNGWFFGPSLLYLGMVTNLYADLIANSSPIFYQDARTGIGAYSRDVRNRYSPSQTIISYDFNSDSWRKQNLDDDIYTVTNTATHAKGLITYLVYRTVTKKSLSAIKKDVGVKARIRDSFSQTYTAERKVTGRITLPKFNQGTLFNGIDKAFSVVRFKRSTTSGTNTFLSVNKTLVLPTTLVSDGMTQEGYPVYKEGNGIQPLDVYEVCCELLDQHLRSAESLSSLVEYPAYRTTEPVRNIVLADSATATDRIEVEVLCYIGSSDITFRARVLEN